MTNIVATGISSKLTAVEKTALRTNIDVDKGTKDYNAYINSILDKATLDLNFAKNEHKVYEAFGPVNKIITDAITTARNSTALYNSPVAAGVSAAINIPRIDYDPLTGVPLGLLVEEARTNLALQSRDFATTWLQNPTASVAVTANATTAFDASQAPCIPPTVTATRWTPWSSSSSTASIPPCHVYAWAAPWLSSHGYGNYACRIRSSSPTPYAW